MAGGRGGFQTGCWVGLGGQPKFQSAILVHSLELLHNPPAPDALAYSCTNACLFSPRFIKAFKKMRSSTKEKTKQTICLILLLLWFIIPIKNKARECQGGRLAHCSEAGWLGVLWRCPAYYDELGAGIFLPNKWFYACLHQMFGKTEERGR